MELISQILKDAQSRARELQLTYEGALLPGEAYHLMQNTPNARLVDVRSAAERELVGTIPGAVEIEWATYPGWKPNPFFLTMLREQVDHESLVMFICRSGARSHHAAVAAQQAGFIDCYNVLQGLEGDRDKQTNQRRMNGWKMAGLPWIQG
jgi:rhodanese-related sulfurtransferase